MQKTISKLENILPRWRNRINPRRSQPRGWLIKLPSIFVTSAARGNELNATYEHAALACYADNFPSYFCLSENASSVRNTIFSIQSILFLVRNRIWRKTTSDLGCKSQLRGMCFFLRGTSQSFKCLENNHSWSHLPRGCLFKRKLLLLNLRKVHRVQKFLV